MLHPAVRSLKAELKDSLEELQMAQAALRECITVLCSTKPKLGSALEGKVDQSFGDALSGAARERKRERGRESTTKANYINKSRE